MDDLILVTHAQGAPGLRLLGIGPGFRPIQGITKLIKLFNENTSWAQNRSRQQIQKMLSGSKVVVSGWYQNKLVGFGRIVPVLYQGLLMRRMPHRERLQKLQYRRYSSVDGMHRQ